MPSLHCSLRRHWLIRFSAILLLILPPIALAEEVSPDPRPNVILIMADDMGKGDLSSLNGGINRTPNIDHLREQSVWFDHAYTASPVCAPARAALLTGRYPHRTGVVTLNPIKYPPLTRIHRDEATLANLFQDSGYATGLIGKWHTGLGNGYHPLSRGFDEFEGFSSYESVLSYFNYTMDINGESLSVSDSYFTTDISQRAIEYIRRHQAKPFFLHLAHYAPHRPLDAPEKKIQPYLKQGFSPDTATVYAMIEIMDEGIGELMTELEKLGLSDNTVVIFTSDNGPDPLVDTRFNQNFKGQKYQVYEGGINVPFMLRWPKRYSSASQDKVIHFIDVLPTLVELCNLDIPSRLAIDGTSFAPTLAGKTPTPPEPRFWQWNRHLPLYTHNAAMRDGDWKLVRPFVTKNIPDGESPLSPALYNISADPTETHNLADKHPERVIEMNAALTKWSQSIEKDRTRSQ